MAEPANPTSEVVSDLAHFEAQNSAEGRLLHYAEGRIRAFWLRQTLTVFGALTIGLLFAPPLGLLLAATALVGEAIDMALLRLVIAALAAGSGGRADALAGTVWCGHPGHDDCGLRDPVLAGRSGS